MIQASLLVGLVLHCLDGRCGRVAWRDPQTLPKGLSRDELQRRLYCDWCGGIQGLSVAVEPIRAHFVHYPPKPETVAAEEVRLRDLRNSVYAQPYAYQNLGGSWGRRRPDPSLLELAHHQLGVPMCNLYSSLTTQEAMVRLYNARDRLGNQPGLPAIFPDAEVPIVRVNSAGERELTRARWGWNKAKFGWVTNARNLTSWPWSRVIEEPRQRCLVPATSFAEYHPSETIPGKTGKPIKAATWFRLAGDVPRPPFAFAGFIKRWNWDKDGPRKKSDELQQGTQVLAVAFLTTDPNAVVEPIHPKSMPVILRPGQFDDWLYGSATTAANLQRPLPSDALEIAFTGAKEDSGLLLPE